MTFTSEMAVDRRKQFPALAREENGRQVVFLDGPAGTQVPQCVIDAFANYFVTCNANHGGFFGTSIENDAMMHEAHQAFADLLNAPSKDEIVFGQNMTSLTFAFSRSLSNTWNEGDEIVVTRLDHDANVTPWVLAAEEKGVLVHYVDIRRDDYTLDLDDLKEKLNEKTRLVAVGCASNATGGVNPVKQISEWAHEVGALVFLDAVHYGPHGLIDVQDWGCDFLACSAYKFFGPHLGIMWGRKELLESLTPYKVRPADNRNPDRWMTGTQSHESIAGGLACVEYLAEIGREIAGDSALSRREALIQAFRGIGDYEMLLVQRLLAGLAEIPEIKVYGITNPENYQQRFATVSFTHSEVPTSHLAKILAANGIYVWHGHYYALQFTETLGLEPEGMIRVGLLHYNTLEEVDRLIDCLKNCIVESHV